MKVHLIHHQDIVDGFQQTRLTHVRVQDANGRFLAFARIAPELLEFIRNLELEVPDALLNWKGKTPCSPNMPNIT